MNVREYVSQKLTEPSVWLEAIVLAGLIGALFFWMYVLEFLIPAFQ